MLYFYIFLFGNAAAAAAPVVKEASHPHHDDDDDDRRARSFFQDAPLSAGDPLNNHQSQAQPAPPKEIPS